MPDDQADKYGKGYITGTIVGIASTSQKQNAALGVREVPDHRHRRGRELRQRDPQRAVDATPRWPRPTSARTRASRRSSRSPQNPNSNTTPASPNGGAYQLTLQNLGYAYESGKLTDLQAGLDDAAKQIDTDIAQAQ